MSSLSLFLVIKIKEHPFLLRAIAFLYSLLFNWYRISYWRWYFSRHTKLSGVFLKNTILCRVLNIGLRSKLCNCTFHSFGKDSRIIIRGNGTVLNNVMVKILDDDSELFIDKYFTTEGGHN